jgi:hypothetical protein
MLVSAVVVALCDAGDGCCARTRSKTLSSARGSLDALRALLSGVHVCVCVEFACVMSECTRAQAESWRRSHGTRSPPCAAATPL